MMLSHSMSNCVLIFACYLLCQEERCLWIQPGKNSHVYLYRFPVRGRSPGRMGRNSVFPFVCLAGWLSGLPSWLALRQKWLARMPGWLDVRLDWLNVRPAQPFEIPYHSTGIRPLPWSTRTGPTNKTKIRIWTLLWSRAREPLTIPCLYATG